MLLLMALPLIIPRQFSEEYLAEHEAQEQQSAQQVEQRLVDVESPAAELPATGEQLQLTD
jgi:hypothetical protein